MAEEIARERIERLFTLARRRMENGRKELADRYVELALKIGMKTQVSIPSGLRKQYCHECESFLLPGENCTVRINSKNDTVNYTCEECGAVNRYGY
ncbi:MAG: ribonuclease P protein component 4 [Candidatus Nanohaloarchaea archaeon]